MRQWNSRPSGSLYIESNDHILLPHDPSPFWLLLQSQDQSHLRESELHYNPFQHSPFITIHSGYIFPIADNFFLSYLIKGCISTVLSEFLYLQIYNFGIDCIIKSYTAFIFYLNSRIMQYCLRSKFFCTIPKILKPKCSYMGTLAGLCVSRDTIR